MKKILLITLLILNFTLGYGNLLEGFGYGKSEGKAKHEALADLASQIEVTVDSTFKNNEKIVNDEYYTNKDSEIVLTSNIKLYGVSYDVAKGSNNFKAKAYFKNNSVALYEKVIADLIYKIELDVEDAKYSNDLVSKKNFYKAALENARKLNSYKNIALILGSNKRFDNKYTVAKLEKLLAEIVKQLNVGRTIFTQVDGELDSYANLNYLSKNFKEQIGHIVKSNPKEFLIGNSDNYNILVTAKIDGYMIEQVDPVYYNGKKISNKSYKATITLSFNVFDVLANYNVSSFVINAKGQSISTRDKALRKAIYVALRHGKKRVEDNLLNMLEE